MGRQHLSKVGKHHEQTERNATASFKKDVTIPVGVIDDMGNLSMEESGDLLALDSKNLAEILGQYHYQSFTKERLNARNKSIFDPIGRNQPHVSAPKRLVRFCSQNISWRP